MRVTKLINFAAVLLFALVVVSCNKFEGHAECRDVKVSGWDSVSVIRFSHANRDTTSQRNIGLILRYNNDYAYDKFLFELETSSPDGLFFRDTLAINIYDNEGKRRGNSAVAVFNIEQPIISGVTLRKRGVYLFSVRQLVESRVKGIEAVGIMISDK